MVATASITRENGLLFVKFPYDKARVEAVKQIDFTREWDKGRQAWKFPADPEIAQKLADLFGMGKDRLPSNVAELLEERKVQQKTINGDLVEKIKAWWPEGFWHQHFGVAELIENPRWLLAWEMGTGKTAVAARRLLWEKEHGGFDGPVLIVAPKSVVSVWKKELFKHAGLSGVVLDGTARDRAEIVKIVANKPNAILICNYELLLRHTDELTKAGFAVVIADEAHRIKNVTSKTSRALRKISTSSKHRWALSGTPSPNGPLDIFGICTFLDTKVFGFYQWTLAKAKYAVMGGPNNMQIVGFKNLGDIERRVATCSSHLKKEQCLDLPEKTFETRHCELTGEQRRVYSELRKDAVAKLKFDLDSYGILTVANVLSESMRLLQVVGGFVPDDDGRIHAIGSSKFGLLEDLLEDLGNNQAIIWASFVNELFEIGRMLDGRCSMHFGDMDTRARVESIEEFRRGDKQFFVATPQSGREGITLVEAATAIYFSRNWNLLNFSQSQDRCYRIGQDKPVTIVSLVATDTVDEKVEVALDRKESLQNLILGGNVEAIL